MSERARSIGPVPEGLDPALRDWLVDARRILLEASSGDLARRIITAAAAAAAGGGPADVDPTTPPVPSGVTVAAGLDFVGINTDPPVFTQGRGYLRTNVYGAKYSGTGALPTFADAQRVHQFFGQVGSFPSEADTHWRIWTVWESRDGYESAPEGGTNGRSAITGANVTSLLQALTKAAQDSAAPYSQVSFRAQLFTVAAPGVPSTITPFLVNTSPITTAAGEVLPAGVYMDAAYVRNLEVALGRFNTAIITTAMIVSLSATKITAGSIAVGEYIQSSNYVPNMSGFRVNGNGDTELNNVVARGTIHASGGSIGGLQIDSTGFQSVGYSPGLAGIRFNSNGTCELGAASIRGQLVTAQLQIGAANFNAQEAFDSGQIALSSTATSYALVDATATNFTAEQGKVRVDVTGTIQAMFNTARAARACQLKVKLRNSTTELDTRLMVAAIMYPTLYTTLIGDLVQAPYHIAVFLGPGAASYAFFVDVEILSVTDVNGNALAFGSDAKLQTTYKLLMQEFKV